MSYKVYLYSLHLNSDHRILNTLHPLGLRLDILFSPSNLPKHILENHNILISTIPFKDELVHGTVKNTIKV